MIFLGKTFAGATFKKGENIDQFLLEYCNKTLTEVVTPTDCNVRNYFFREQTNLQKITFGDGCTKLDYGVCQYCTSLQEVYIPNSVTTIESDAFDGCSGIHFIIDAETSSISGYPWGATDCTVEWLRGGDAPIIGSDFIFYNDYNTMEQSSQQSNGWHGFVFNPSSTPCVNPEALDYMMQGRPIVGIEIMTNPYARLTSQPLFVQIYDRENTSVKITSSNMSMVIPQGNFEEFIHFDFEQPIVMYPYGRYCVDFTLTPDTPFGQGNQSTQISPATFTMEDIGMDLGCYWNNFSNMTHTEMVVFKLIFE